MAVSKKLDRMYLDIWWQIYAINYTFSSSNDSYVFYFQDLERAAVENIHGSEYVHLSQTCQNLFGPLSHNLLTPEVAIG